MVTVKYRVALFSGNPDRLAAFYIKILGFKQVVKIDRVDDYGYGIEVAKGYKLWIARHSEIEGQNKDPYRIMLSLYVDDIAEYFARIRLVSNATIIEEPTLACKNIKGEERIVGAFLDPDGNCIQLMQLTGK